MKVFALPLLCVILSKQFLVYAFVPVSSTALKSSAMMSKADDNTGTRDSVKENNISKRWTTEMDWILQLAVPRYTVVSGSNSQQRVTFWNQLKHSKPDFEGISDNELEQRYREILKNADFSSKNLPHHLCGPAPPVLTDWCVRENENIMVGKAENGSTIWFRLNRGGKLESEHRTLNIDHVDLLYEAGGFVESTDGLIYELGPATADWKENVQEINRPWVDLAHKLDENTRKMILFSITVSSVLSGSVAFAIGQQMAPAPQQTPKITITTVRRDQLPSTSSAPTSFNSLTYARSEISIQEQRTLQELRVLREKRALADLEERIKVDEAKLSSLQREETRQEGAALGFY